MNARLIEAYAGDLVLNVRKAVACGTIGGALYAPFKECIAYGVLHSVDMPGLMLAGALGGAILTWIAASIVKAVRQPSQDHT